VLYSLKLSARRRGRPREIISRNSSTFFLRSMYFQITDIIICREDLKGQARVDIEVKYVESKRSGSASDDNSHAEYKDMVVAAGARSDREVETQYMSTKTHSVLIILLL
jgi:hypothetical protein